MSDPEKQNETPEPTPEPAPAPETSEAPPAAAAAPSTDKETNQWSMFLHLSVLAGGIIPGAGLILPIVLWQMKKDNPVIDQHGKNVVNWIISLVIYFAISTVLLIIAIGAIGYLVLGLLSLIYAIIGGIKANNGEVWAYPGTIKILK